MEVSATCGLVVDGMLGTSTWHRVNKQPSGARHELMMTGQAFEVWGVEGDKEDLARTVGTREYLE